LTLLLFVGVLLWTLSLAARTSFGRDENVFVAGGQLMARDGLLPYRDFRHYHTPYLIFAYAALFKATDYLLLVARLFSALCATGIAAVCGWMGFQLLEKAPTHYRYILTWAGVLLLIATPLYAFTSGYAWNHNLATLLAILAFALLWQSARSLRPVGWIFASGVLIGLAVGTRTSFVTALPAFALALWFHPQAGSLGGVIKRWVWLGLGMLLALLPVVIFYLAAPGGFVYDNWTYHLLNTQYRVEASYDSPIALGDRLWYALNDVFGRQGNLLLFVSFVFAAGAVLFGAFRRKLENAFEPLLFLGTALLVAVGSFLPSPSWYQYFYAPVPFALCAVWYGLSRLNAAESRRWLAAAFCTLAVVANLFQVQEYRRMTFLLSPETWRPVQAHRVGEQIRQLVPTGKVLTLTPIFALEGGVPIYPEFATGPFVWRVASLMNAEQRRAVNAIAPEDLETFLADDPPAAVLVGAGGEVESPLVAYAQVHGYQAVELNSDLTLWVTVK
jgi:4-amino-4-deoxy-L-arabinose transferase-like glycosyltransferase